MGNVSNSNGPDGIPQCKNSQSGIADPRRVTPENPLAEYNADA
jgi:hypothetical protein